MENVLGNCLNRIEPDTENYLTRIDPDSLLEGDTAYIIGDELEELVCVVKDSSGGFCGCITYSTYDKYKYKYYVFIGGDRCISIGPNAHLVTCVENGIPEFIISARVIRAENAEINEFILRGDGKYFWRINNKTFYDGTRVGFEINTRNINYPPNHTMSYPSDDIIVVAKLERLGG